MAPTGTVTENTLRLACICCDRIDGDGITMADALKAGWQDIQFLTERFRCKDDWCDHLGECMECYRKNTPKNDRKKRKRVVLHDMRLFD